MFIIYLFIKHVGWDMLKFDFILLYSFFLQILRKEKVNPHNSHRNTKAQLENYKKYIYNNFRT